jgi:hypothetical protein
MIGSQIKRPPLNYVFLSYEVYVKFTWELHTVYIRLIKQVLYEKILEIIDILYKIQHQISIIEAI